MLPRRARSTQRVCDVCARQRDEDVFIGSRQPASGLGLGLDGAAGGAEVLVVVAAATELNLPTHAAGPLSWGGGGGLGGSGSSGGSGGGGSGRTRNCSCSLSVGG